MAGCYGNDPEDKFFESKLMDYLDGDEMPRCEKCGNDYEMENSDSRDPDTYCSRDCEVDDIMDMIEKHDIINANHLEQHLKELETLRKNCDESLNDIDEIKGYLDHIVDQIRKR